MLHRIKALGLAILIASVAITLILFVTAKPVGFVWNSQVLRVSSQLAALFGTLLLALSFLLSSKIKLLEKIFGGLDVMYYLHHLLGALAFVLLLYHPLLLLAQALPFPEVLITYLNPFTSLPYFFGQMALLTMTMLLIFTLFVKLPYHIWKATHQWMGLVLVLAALHLYLIASDTAQSITLRVWMLSWIAIAIGSFLYQKLLFRWIGPRYIAQVSAVRSINDIVAVTVLQLGKLLDFKPGQFVYLTFDDQAIGRESHPFSIVCNPESSTLEFWSKQVGDFTTRLALLKPGTKVTIEGPYGNFMETAQLPSPIICIAGGIGITPFVSLLNSELPQRMICIHSVQTIDDPSVQLAEATLHESDQHVYQVHQTKMQGRLTGAYIAETQPEWKSARYFFCGPLPMMNSLRDQLLSMGVRPSKIFFENFSLSS